MREADPAASPSLSSVSVRRRQCAAFGCIPLRTTRDGKEGVRGSSPREGFASSLLISSVRRLWRRQKRGAASTERPRGGVGGVIERPQPSS